MSDNGSGGQVSQKELIAIIRKLLDRAGMDPRLTPRILRAKAEEKLALKRGDLKQKRKDIKNMIWQWHLDKKRAAKMKEDESSARLKAFCKLARVTGNVPAALRGLDSELTANQRADTIRQRLIDCGVAEAQAEWPTEDIIEKAQKKHEMARDIRDNIDPNLIIPEGQSRKRSLPQQQQQPSGATDGSEQNNTDKRVKVEAGDREGQPAKREYSGEDEDAEF